MPSGGRGIRTVLPPAVGTLMAIALVAIAVVASVAGADASPLTKTQVPAVTKSVLLVGDSVPKMFANDFAQAAAEHGYGLVSAARGGCPATGVAKVFSSGKRWKKHTCSPRVVIEQDAMVAKYRPALVIWWSRYELAPRNGPDGKVLPLGSRAYLRAQEASFDKRVSALTRLGARLVTVQIEPPGRDLAVRNPLEKHFLVGQTLLHRRDVVNAWNAFLASHKGPMVFSISIKHLVCRDARSPCDDRLANGESARPDGVHYSETAQHLLAPLIFEEAWRVSQLGSAPRR
jgi:hypothetical protein